MDYKEKYEQALERAKVYHTGGSISDAHITEVIFPELKESEDERIRKTLIEYIKGIKSWNYFLGISKEQMIAWLEKRKEQKKVSIWKHWKNGIAGNGEDKQVYLIRTDNTYTLSSCLGFECDYIELSELDNLMLEKQGEKTIHINKEDCGIDGLYHAIKILEETVGRVTGYQSDDGILEHKAAINAVKELYKKQGDKKPKVWNAEDEQNLNVVLSFIDDEYLRRWLKDKLCYDTLDANKVIEWLKTTIKEVAENYGVYKETRLTLPYNSIEDLINDFKKDFGL